MDELVSQFEEVRAEFLDVLRQFPARNRSRILFGKWSLKDVVAHLTGWDQYFVDILISLQAGEEPPYWGNMDKFNEASVQKRRKKPWRAVYDEFVDAGDEFIRCYTQLPTELRDARFWKGRSYTPIRILEIDIHHYAVSHLKPIKKALARIETEKTS
jgi:hypothetical protein